MSLPLQCPSPTPWPAGPRAPALTTLVATLALACLPAVVAAQAAPAVPELSVYRAFNIPPHGAWVDVPVQLEPGAWRVGAPDGPPAAPADLARLRSTPGVLVVAGRCAGAQSGSTHYPCAFELAPHAAAAAPPADPVAAVAALALWHSTSDDRLARYAPGIVHAASLARGGLGPIAAERLGPLLPDDKRLLGFYAPAAAALRPGPASGAVALQLRLRAVDNPLARGRFEREGLLVLSTRPWPVQPATPAVAGRAI